MRHACRQHISSACSRSRNSSTVAVLCRRERRGLVRQDHSPYHWRAAGVAGYRGTSCHAHMPPDLPPTALLAILRMRVGVLMACLGPRTVCQPACLPSCKAPPHPHMPTFTCMQTGDWSVKAPLPACSAVYDGVGDLWYSGRQADGSCGAVTVCRGGLEGAACQQVGAQGAADVRLC